MCVCGVHSALVMKGAPSSQNKLNLNLQPLRGIDRILSHFDTTDLWCAICIIVHFYGVFISASFLSFFFFFPLKFVQFCFVECIRVDVE